MTPILVCMVIQLDVNEILAHNITDVALIGCKGRDALYYWLHNFLTALGSQNNKYKPNAVSSKITAKSMV